MTTNNPDAPPRIWPWTDEPWYLAQRVRWNAGWKFGPAVHPRRDHVSMEMTLARDGWPVESHSFWVSKKNKLPKDVHSEVLALCERTARALSAPTGQGEAATDMRSELASIVALIELGQHKTAIARINQLDARATTPSPAVDKGEVAQRLTRKIIASLTPNKYDEAVEALYDDGNKAKIRRGKEVHTEIASIIEAELA